MQIKNFNCFKVTEKKNDKQPDYRLSAKIGEEYVEIGAGWVKENPKGKYISFKLADQFQDKKGYSLIEEVNVAPEGVQPLPQADKAWTDIDL